MSKVESRCLGLIGGLGVGAAMHYYTALARAHDQRHHVLKLLMVHADMSRAVGYVEENRIDDLADYLATLIGCLKDGGADIAVIPAVTPHICIRELTVRSPLPLIDMLQVVREAKIMQRVALFGTRFTIETDLFGALENVVRPKPDEVDQIHEVYVRTAQRNQGTEEDREILNSIAHRLIERDGVEAIVFAGTDLALLYNESNTPFPFVDCAQLHIDAIIKPVLP
jgi:aspartate racemase